MDRDPLFSKYDFSAAVRNAPAALAKAIEKLDDSHLFEADQEQLLNALVAEHRINVPVLNVDGIAVSQREVDVDLSLDRRERFMRDLRAAYHVKGTEVSFRVPYQGERDVFYCRPSTYSLNPPRADIEHDAVVIRVVRRDQNADEFRKSFDSTISQIQQALEQLRHDCVGLDETLRSTATSKLAQRREKREKDRGLIDALGFSKPNR